MCSSYQSRFRRTTIATCGVMLSLGGAAMAQSAMGQSVMSPSVQVFDDAPSIEQLRAIMIPESRPGVGRTIVIQRPDSGPSPVQRAATQVLSTPEPRTPAPEAPTMHAAASIAPHAMPPHAAPLHATQEAPAPAAEAVAFHINFAFNSTELPESAFAMIDTMAQLMKETPSVKLRVEGHTDAVGAIDYNIVLSQRRAQAVAAYLVDHGVDPSRLVLVGKGMAEPLTHNRYDPANRRVQFVRIA